MNDAERDAWLREALRHAPDSDALPPRGVSEAILMKARAAAVAGTTAPAARRAGSRDAHAGAWAALWHWLARPPVAAGFASVMAATLVGLMWWDRPMDEAMPRPPALASDRAPAAAPPAAVTESAKTAPDARPMNEAANNAAADDGAVRRRQRGASEQAGAPDAKLAPPAAAPAPRSVDLLAKARPLPSEKKNEAPSPSTEMQREAPSPGQSLDAAAANDARRKDVEARRSRAEEVERAAAAAAPRPAAAPPAVQPPPARAAEPPPQAALASGGLAADERRAAAPADNAFAAKEKSAAAAAPVSPAPSSSVAAAPARDKADAPRLQRQNPSAFGGLREQDAAGQASTPVPSMAAPAAPFPGESNRSGADARSRADAPARMLAAVAADPERWLRQTAGGDTVALDAGWRAWLAELDAAAAGRWRPLDAAVPPAEAAAARDGSTTVRLVNAGLVAAIVRVDGTSVRVDAAPGSGADRWQATLAAAAAERLRSTARRLSP